MSDLNQALINDLQYLINLNRLLLAQVREDVDTSKLRDTLRNIADTLKLIKASDETKLFQG